MDELNGKKSAIILLGNKTDLDSQRRVTTDEGVKLAQEWGIKYVEASAKLGEVSLFFFLFIFSYV